MWGEGKWRWWSKTLSSVAVKVVSIGIKNRHEAMEWEEGREGRESEYLNWTSTEKWGWNSTTTANGRKENAALGRAFYFVLLFTQ